MLPGFGVVGTPNSVRAYVPILKSNGFKVVALWGRTKEDAATVAAELNIPFHSSNVDEVIIIKKCIGLNRLILAITTFARKNK
jgi:predicted dehydrogenase